MNLLLKRTYYPTATNGTLFVEDDKPRQLCYTIELPWLNNQRGVSCIPEGRYKLTKRYSPSHGQHLLVNGVPGRDLVLLHEANWAVKELRGCIAPVTTLDKTPGVGWRSGRACDLIESLAFAELEKENEVWLTITKA